MNLLCDRYLIDYGPAGVTGPPEAHVRLWCQVVRGNPPIAGRLRRSWPESGSIAILSIFATMIRSAGNWPASGPTPHGSAAP